MLTKILAYFNNHTPRRHSSLQETSLASSLVIIAYFVRHKGPIKLARLVGFQPSIYYMRCASPVWVKFRICRVKKKNNNNNNKTKKKWTAVSLAQLLLNFTILQFKEALKFAILYMCIFYFNKKPQLFRGHIALKRSNVVKNRWLG